MDRKIGKSSGAPGSGQEPARRRNVRGEGERLRDEIIDAATKVLARLGPEDPFSLRAVAKEAGIAAPSVYIHFADRNELLLAVLEKLFAELIALREEAEAKAAKAGGGPRERLVAASMAYVRFGLERTGHYRVLYEGRVVARLEDPKLASFGRPLQIRTAQLIREIAAEPRARELKMKPERLALLIWSGLHGIISLQINKPTLEWPAAENLAKEMINAIIAS